MHQVDQLVITQHLMTLNPSVDEFRIVGDLQSRPSWCYIYQGRDGNTPTATITVDTNKAHGLFKDTPVLISGITTAITSYNGSFLVGDILSPTQVYIPNIKCS